MSRLSRHPLYVANKEENCPSCLLPNAEPQVQSKEESAISRGSRCYYSVLVVILPLMSLCLDMKCQPFYTNRCAGLICAVQFLVESSSSTWVKSMDRSWRRVYIQPAHRSGSTEQWLSSSTPRYPLFQPPTLRTSTVLVTQTRSALLPVCASQAQQSLSSPPYAEQTGIKMVSRSHPLAQRRRRERRAVQERTSTKH